MQPRAENDDDEDQLETHEYAAYCASKHAYYPTFERNPEAISFDRQSFRRKYPYERFKN